MLGSQPVLRMLCDGIPLTGEALRAFGNDVQHAVDTWLRAGRPSSD